MNLTIKTYKGHRIGSHMNLGSASVAQLVALFKRPPRRVLSKLDGRSAICRDEIIGLGRVAVKTYTRGGLIRHFNRFHYIRAGRPRCQKEFETLVDVRALGLSVPEPIAFAYRGWMTYRGWLITREVESPRSLAEICIEDENLCRTSMTAVAEQIRHLIEHRIKHVDLHPGNVLVDGRNRAYIVDFDGARTGDCNKKELRDHYIARWSRAIAKHKLPSLLCEELITHLSTSPNSR